MFVWLGQGGFFVEFCVTCWFYVFVLYFVYGVGCLFSLFVFNLMIAIDCCVWWF